MKLKITLFLSSLVAVSVACAQPNPFTQQLASLSQGESKKSTKGAGNASERAFIREGMSEADVLAKIGPPDHKGKTKLDGAGTGGKAKKTKKQSAQTWTYRPAVGDAQTTTTITIANGKVVKVERKVTR